MSIIAFFFIRTLTCAASCFICENKCAFVLLHGPVKALLNAHALKNVHSPIWTLKMAIFLTILGKVPASNKRPFGNKSGKYDLTFCNMFPNSLLNRQMNKLVFFLYN